MKKTNPKILAQRVQIARDVLEHITAGIMQVMTGTVCDTDTDLSAANSATVRRKLRRVQRCDVCAKGAVLFAFVKRHDSVPGDVFSAASGCTDAVYDVRQLLKLFPAKMLAEMETLFERRTFDLNEDLLGEEVVEQLITTSNERYSKYSPARLCETMLRLIQNNGEYIELT